MNLLLVDAAEITTEATTRQIVSISDRRASHLRQVLGAVVGQTVKAGIVAGGIGTATVVSDDGTAIVLAMMLIPSTVTARPRFLYTAFPLVICFAAWWDSSTILRRVLRGDPEGHGWALFVGLNCAGLAALTALYGVYGVIP